MINPPAPSLDQRAADPIPSPTLPLASAAPHLSQPANHQTAALDVAAAPSAARHTLPHGLPASLVKAVEHVGKNDRVELLLDPVELGKVRFELSTLGDRVSINMSVERPETLDLLRRNLDDLRAEFRSAGLDASTLNFSQWGKGSDNQPPATFAPADPGPEDIPLAPASPVRTNQSTSAQGLDLRL